MKRARAIDCPLPDDLGGFGRPVWRTLEAALAWQIDLGRVPIFRRKRRWLRDPDGLLICCFAGDGR